MLPLSPSVPHNFFKWTQIWLSPCLSQLDHWRQKLLFLTISGCELLLQHNFIPCDSSVLKELQTIGTLYLEYIKMSLYSLSIILLRRIIILKGWLEIFHSGLSEFKNLYTHFLAVKYIKICLAVFGYVIWGDYFFYFCYSRIVVKNSIDSRYISSIFKKPKERTYRQQWKYATEFSFLFNKYLMIT